MKVAYDLLVPAAGIEVPGGVVLIDLRRQKGRVVTWLRIALNAFDELDLKRDIVIQDASRSRELYREGPYDGILVTQPLERILAEIRSEGLDQFLFKRQVEWARIGLISQPSGQIVGLWSWAATSVRYLTQRMRRHADPPPPRDG
jgi:hypothetical protein